MKSKLLTRLTQLVQHCKHSYTTGRHLLNTNGRVFANQGFQHSYDRRHATHAILMETTGKKPALFLFSRSKRCGLDWICEMLKGPVKQANSHTRKCNHVKKHDKSEFNNL